MIPAGRSDRPQLRVFAPETHKTAPVRESRWEAYGSKQSALNVNTRRGSVSLRLYYWTAKEWARMAAMGQVPLTIRFPDGSRAVVAVES